MVDKARKNVCIDALAQNKEEDEQQIKSKPLAHYHLNYYTKWENKKNTHTAEPAHIRIHSSFRTAVSMQ